MVAEWIRSPTAAGAARLEAWLRTASLDDVLFAILDQKLASWQAPPYLSSLLAKRFGEFPFDARVEALQTLAQTSVTSRSQFSYPAMPIMVEDLTREGLPSQATALIPIFQSLSGYGIPGLREALAAWAADDFPAAQEFCRQAKVLGMGQKMIQALAARDPAAAQRQAEASEDWDIKSGFATVLARTDFSASLHWMREQGVRGDFSSSDRLTLPGPLEAAMTSQPETVAAFLRDQPDQFMGLFGQRVPGTIFAVWTSRDAAAARAWLAEHPLPERLHQQAEVALLMQDVASQPADQALATWQTLPEREREQMASTLAERFAGDDPATAAARLKSLVAPEFYPEMLGALSWFLPVDDPAAAAAWLAEMPTKSGALSSQARRFISQPLEQLEAVLDSLPAERSLTLRSAFAQSLAESDPSKAMALLTPEIGHSERSEDVFLLSTVAFRLAQSDPARAADWVRSLPEGDAREWAALNLVASWMKFDAAAADAWVEALPEGASRDRALAELAAGYSLAGEADAALRAAALVGEETPRREAYGQALQALWHRDPAAATARLAAASLSAVARDQLAAELARGEHWGALRRCFAPMARGGRHRPARKPRDRRGMAL